MFCTCGIETVNPLVVALWGRKLEEQVGWPTPLCHLSLNRLRFG